MPQRRVNPPNERRLKLHAATHSTSRVNPPASVVCTATTNLEGCHGNATMYTAAAADGIPRLNMV